MTVKRLAGYAGFVLVSGGCAADRLVAPAAAPPPVSNILRIRGAGVEADPLFIIDGQVYGAGRPRPDVDPAQILIVQVIKGREAVKFYGPAGVHGVVVITTHEGARRAGGVVLVPANSFELRGHAAIAANSPLVLVDGARVPVESLQGIDADRILDVQVLKGRAAIRQYGHAGADGVILIRTRPVGR
jgi:hypothetical protein